MIIPQFIISVVLFFVLFFGIGFLMNMLLRSTWFVAVIYPLICVMIIDNISTLSYISNPQNSFSALTERMMAISIWDFIILATGFIGAIIAGVTIKSLRQKGYQMF